MGDVIAGRYELLDPIASGAAGSVWRAVDHRSGVVCAAKVMRQRDSSDMLRFVREKSIRVEHRHLLTPHGFGAEDDHVVIGMPLASGGTLQDLLQSRGPLSDPLAALVLSQLLAGLARLHEEGWIHRDVKPGNMLFEPVGRGEPIMRLADFGIAVHERDVRLTATGFVNGTPGYVAPEIMSTGKVSPAQDRWAAGVVGLVMLSPRTAVDRAGSSSPAVRAVLAGSAAPLARVIASLLEVDPERRCPDLSAASAELARFAAASPGPWTDRGGVPLEFPDRLPPLPASSPFARTEVLRADTDRTALRATGLLPRPGTPRTGADAASPDPAPTRPRPVAPRRR
ncbi:serine/threonine-protein kinase, partial [Brachybacterium hainanense]